MRSKLFILCAIALVMGLHNGLFAQLQDEKSVTVTMDLQPILQLDMETADQIEFVFDDIKDYYAGITKYGADYFKGEFNRKLGLVCCWSFQWYHRS